MDSPSWSTRIRELQEQGLSLRQIGKKIGLTKSSVGDLATGRNLEPRGEAAVRLHRLHENRCRRRAKRA